MTVRVRPSRLDVASHGPTGGGLPEDPLRGRCQSDWPGTTQAGMTVTVTDYLLRSVTR